jgi:hypothetical protein
VDCPGGAWHWVSEVLILDQTGLHDADFNLWTCSPCGPSCDPTQNATIYSDCGANDPACAQSLCLQLCAGYTTTVTVCGNLPIDPAHAPVSSWHPGCDLPCNDPSCPPGSGAVTGPFPGPGGNCWVYIIVGDLDGCFCFTFDHFLAAGVESFTGVAGDNEVQLSWVTGSEAGVSRFDIVRNDEVIAHVTASNPNGASYNYMDRSAHNGTTYTYRLRTVDVNGNATDAGFTATATPSFTAAIVTEYALLQNFPNPFNPTTQIAFDVLNTNAVTLKIYNAAGQEVATLVNGANYEGGHRYVVNFDATNLTSGLYFYTVKIGNEFNATKKMLLVK